jgi:hypothetical protein
VERDLFEERLRIVVDTAVDFARKHVLQFLPDKSAYLVYPNQSYDGNPLIEDELVFPSDALCDGEFHGPWPLDETVSFLWRSGMVPEWIDVAVQSEDGIRTLVALRSCGRFTSTEELLYHRNGGMPPFRIKSPVLPPGWVNLEVSGKFDLYWRRTFQKRY